MKLTREYEIKTGVKFSYTVGVGSGSIYMSSVKIMTLH